MIKPVLIFVILLLQPIAPELKKMRDCYVLISKDETAALTLKKLAQKSNSVPANISAAYYAASEMALAQYKINPISKVNTFKRGKDSLEAAVMVDTFCIEVRYIRLAIQQNAPSFLGYNKSIINDRAYLIHNLKLTKLKDPDLFSAIYAYLLARCRLTEQEKTALRS